MSKRSDDVRLLLAGAAPLVRAALAGLIVQAGYRLRKADQVSSRRTVLKRIRRKEVDLVVLVYDTAAGLGLNLIEQIRVEEPDLPLLVINSTPSNHEAMTIIRAGVSGYLGRKSTPEDFARSIERSLAGGHYVSPEVAERLLFQFGAASGDSIDEQLSPREVQVLGLIAKGKKRAEIAETLALSPQTISSYRARIMEKLGLRTTAELIRYAVDHKLV